MNESLPSGIRLVSHDSWVVAGMISGNRHRIVIDTLLCPADMAEFQDATLVVYTHADWDHCWGTGAFTGVPVIAHERSRERLLDPRARELLAEKQQSSPDLFRESRLTLPDITFSHSLTIDAGGLTVQVQHLPGHTADSAVVYVPELDLLFGGDALELPLVCFNETGHLRQWGAGLRQWCGRGIRHVIPSHGPVSGPELLERTAAYIETLLDRTERLLKRGATLAEIQAAIPATELVPDLAQYEAWYAKAHEQNVAQAVAELTPLL